MTILSNPELDAIPLHHNAVFGMSGNLFSYYWLPWPTEREIANNFNILTTDATQEIRRLACDMLDHLDIDVPDYIATIPNQLLPTFRECVREVVECKCLGRTTVRARQQRFGYHDKGVPSPHIIIDGKAILITAHAVPPPTVGSSQIYTILEVPTGHRAHAHETLYNALHAQIQSGFTTRKLFRFLRSVLDLVSYPDVPSATTFVPNTDLDLHIMHSFLISVRRILQSHCPTFSNLFNTYILDTNAAYYYANSALDFATHQARILAATLTRDITDPLSLHMQRASTDPLSKLDAVISAHTLVYDTIEQEYQQRVIDLQSQLNSIGTMLNNAKRQCDKLATCESLVTLF
jgi:hypothetical protein